MKISEFRILRYGPLKDTGQIRLNNFNILWGKNERGKTLLVDALLKMLLKNDCEVFERINRVSEFPEGYVIINYRGKDYKIPEKNNPVRFISAADFRNIFVIRDSDLTISEEAQYYSDISRRLIGSKIAEIQKIIDNLTYIGRLTKGGDFSNRSDDFKLKDRIKEAGNLLQNIRIFMQQLQKENYEELEIELIQKKKELERIKNKLELLKLAERKEKYIKASDLINRLEQLRNRLKEYKKYELSDAKKWNNFKNALENLKSALDKSKQQLQQSTKTYNELLLEKKKLEKGIKLAQVRKALAEKLKKLIDQRETLEMHYEECSLRLDELKKKLESILKEKRKLDTNWNFILQKNIKARVENLKNEFKSLEKSQKLKSLSTTLMILNFAAGTATVLSGALLNSKWIVISGIIFGSIGILFGILRYKAIESEYTKDSWQDIIKEVSPIFRGVTLNIDNIEYYIYALEDLKRGKEIDLAKMEDVFKEVQKECEKIMEEIRKRDTEIKKIVGELKIGLKKHPTLYLGDIKDILQKYEELKAYYSQLIGKLQEIDRQNNEIKKSIVRLENDIQDIHKEIQNLSKKCGLSSLKELEVKVEEKQKIENEFHKIRESLATLFDYQSQNLENELNNWKRRLKELEQYKDKKVAIKYDEKVEQQLLEKFNQLNEEIKELELKISEYKNIFKNIEAHAQKILLSADPSVILSPLSQDAEISCSGISDLERISHLLYKFIRDNEKRRRHILIAKDIFDKLKKEEEKKIAELFSQDSLAIRYFRKITNGLYRDIIYEPETGEIKVMRNDGLKLSAGQLSGGTWDQLYFAIRLSLAEKIINEKAFFILDDPFIKADPDRLISLFNTLKDLSQEGWQIIYLSSKGEIKQLYELKYKDTARYITV